MRSKQEKYFFIPESDIPDIPITAEYIESIRGEITPSTSLGLSDHSAKALRSNPEGKALFLRICEDSPNLPKDLVVHWVFSELLPSCKFEPILGDSDFRLQFSRLLFHVDARRISVKAAKAVLKKLLGRETRDVDGFVSANSLWMISDTSNLSELISTFKEDFPGSSFFDFMLRYGHIVNVKMASDLFKK